MSNKQGTAESVYYDVIELENEELNLTVAYESVFATFGDLPKVTYTLMFAATKNERRAFRFKVSGNGVVKRKRILE